MSKCPSRYIEEGEKIACCAYVVGLWSLAQTFVSRLFSSPTLHTHTHTHTHYYVFFIAVSVVMKNSGEEVVGRKEKRKGSGKVPQERSSYWYVGVVAYYYTYDDDDDDNDDAKDDIGHNRHRNIRHVCVCVCFPCIRDETPFFGIPICRQKKSLFA